MRLFMGREENSGIQQKKFLGRCDENVASRHKGQFRLFLARVVICLARTN